MKNILIIGYGEVGKSLYNLYKEEVNNNYNIFILDLYKVEEESISTLTGKEQIDVMHICYPYGNGFAESVIGNITEHEPELTIIESTIPVYTTKDIYLATHTNIVHSPIMGKHPHLTESIKTFTKIVGGCSAKATELACSHFNKLNIDIIIYNNAEESEAAKLLDTAYYGWNILYMKHVHKFCKERNLDFENVYTTTNEIYNTGYSIFGDYQFIRPVLKYMTGKIGGHCVRPNFELLKKDFYPAKLAIELDDGEE